MYKGATRSYKSNRTDNGQKKKEKRQIMICKTLHRKQRLSNTNLTTIRRLTQVHRKGKQLLHHHANGKPIKKLTFMAVSTQTEKNYMTTFRFTYLL
jgi:hypothetical protein